MEYAEVRDDLFDALLLEARENYLKDRAAELLIKLDSGTAVDVLAQDTGLEWQVLLAATRTNPNLDRDILEAGFALTAPGDGERGFTQALLANGDLAVIEVSNVSEGDLSELPMPILTQLRDAIIQRRTQDVLAAYRDGLRAAAEVELF